MDAINYSIKQTLDEALTNYTKQLHNQVQNQDPNAYANQLVLQKIKASRAFRKDKGFDSLIAKLQLFLCGRGWETKELSQEHEQIYGLKKETEYPQLIQNLKSSTISIDEINVNCVPKGQSETATAIAANLSDILGTFFSDNNNKKQIHKAKVESRGLPMAITMVNTDAYTQLINFKHIALERFWWEPTATDMNDCNYVFVGDIANWDYIFSISNNDNSFNHDLINELYSACLSTAQGQSKQYANRHDNENNVIQNIYERYYKHLSVSPLTATDIAQKVPVDYFYERTWNHKTKQFEIYRYIVLYQTVIIAKQKLNITKLPFAILKEYNYHGSFYGRSSVEIGLPIIEALMFLDAQIITAVSKNMTNTYPVPDTWNIEELLNKRTTGSQFVSVPDNVFSFLAQYGKGLPEFAPYKIDEQVVALRQMLVEELQSLVGINAITLGEGFGSATNGAAVNSMINQSTSRDTDAIVEFSFYLNQLALLVIDAISNEYLNATDQYTFYVPNQDATDLTRTEAFKPVTINKDDLKDGIDTVLINTELLRANRNDVLFANLLSIYQISSQNPVREDAIVRPEDLINLLRLPNKTAILQRAVSNSDVVGIAQTARTVQKAFQLAQTPQGAMLDANTAAAMIYIDNKNEKEAILQGKEPVSAIDELQAQAQAVPIPEDDATLLETQPEQPIPYDEYEIDENELI